MIKPTVGRVVWVRMSESQLEHLRRFSSTAHRLSYDPKDGQPMAGIVSYVWNERMVNLSVFDHNGRQYNFTSVTLLQDDEQPNGAGIWAEWVPYQNAGAKKVEQLELKLTVDTSEVTKELEKLDNRVETLKATAVNEILGSVYKLESDDREL
jgi:hypothetical protein